MTDADRGRVLAQSGKYQPSGNGYVHDDIPPPDEPPGDDQADAKPTTWEPVALEPYLRGEITRPEPGIGAWRSDGIQFLYPGREHSVLGGTEAGKTWFALMCVAAELGAGRRVAYVHFEESDPASTIDRLRLLGVADGTMVERLAFAAPTQRVRLGWLDPLLTIRPSLVVLDGINEAIVMHGQKVDLDGWSLFRQQVILPFKKAGAAVLGCDHMPISTDESRRDAYGTGHKGNILDGVRLMLVNQEPFGRGMRGRSNVFVTKDRPGSLRTHGRPGRTAGVTFIGTLIIDDCHSGPDFKAAVYAPKDEGEGRSKDPAVELAGIVHDVIAELPDHAVSSMRLLFAEVRRAGHQVRDEEVRDALADLAVAGRLVEFSGRRGARGYRAVLAQDVPTDSTASLTASQRPPYGGSDAVGRSQDGSASDAVGRSGTQWTKSMEEPDATDQETAE